MESIGNPKGIWFVWVGGRVWVDGVGGRAGGLAGLGGVGWQREGRGACRESEHNVLASCTDHIVVNLLWLDHIGPYSGGSPSAPLFFFQKEFILTWGHSQLVRSLASSKIPLRQHP